MSVAEGEPEKTSTGPSHEQAFIAPDDAQHLFLCMSEGVLVQSPSGEILAANPAAAHLLGFGIEAMEGTAPPAWLAKLLRPDGTEMVLEEYPPAVAFRSGQPVRDRLVGVLAPGADQPRWLNVSAIPQCRPGETTPYNVITLLADVTEKRDVTDRLRASDRRFETIMDHLPSAAFIKNPAGQVIYANRAFATSLEPEQPPVPSEPNRTFIPTELARRLAEGEYEAIAEGGFESTEHRVAGPDGPTFWLVVKFPLPESGPEPLLAVTTTDVTRRRVGRQPPLDSGALMRAVFRAAPVGLGLVKDRVILDVNEYTGKILGFEPDEMVGMSMREFYPDQETFDEVGRELYGQLYATGAGMVESRWRHKDGRVLDVILGAAQVIPGDPDSPLIVTSMDVTALKKDQKALAENEDRLRAIFRTVPAAIGVLKNRVMLDVSEHLTAMTGYTREEALDQDARMLYASQEDYESIGRDMYPRIIAKGSALGEGRWKAKDGRILDVLLSATAIEPGNPDSAVVFASVDITELKQARQALQESEALMRTMFGAAPVGLVVVKGRAIIDANVHMCTMIGYDREEMLGGDSRIIYEDDATYHAVGNHLYGLAGAAGSEPLETRWLRKNGEVVNVLLGATKIFPGDPESPFIVSALDITARKHYEQALANSEAHLRAIFGTAPVGLGVVKDRRIVDVNPHICTMLGYEREQLVGRDAREIYENQAAYEAAGRQVYGDSGSSGNVPPETRWVRKDGRPIDVLISATRIFPDDPDSAFIVSALDITARKAGERALTENAAQMRALLQATPVGIGVLKNRIMLDVNEEMSTMTGFSRDELAGHDAVMLYPGLSEYEAVGRGLYPSTIEGGKGSVETVWRTKDGRLINVLLNAASTSPGDRDAVIICAATDITARKQNERALADSEATMRAMFRAAPIALGIIKDRCIQDTNDVAARMVGRQTAELLGQSVRLFYAYPETFEQVGRDIYRQIEEAGTASMDTLWRHKDGHLVDVLLGATKINPQDPDSAFIFSAQDVTARKQNERALAASEALMRAIFRSAPVCMGVVKDRKILNINERASLMVGYEPEELVGADSLILYPDRETYEAVGRDIYAQVDRVGTGTVETRWRHRDGHLLDVIINLTRADPADPDSAFVFATLDITDSKSAHKALLESEERFRTVIDTMMHGLMFYDPDFHVTYASPAACRILGCTPDELHLSGVLGTGWKYIKEDGSLFPAMELPVGVSMRTGQRQNDVTMGVIKPGAEDPIWVSMNTTPVFKSGEDKPYQVYTIFQDVTQTRQMERLIRQQERLAAVGQLSAGIAHDFNNLLMAIIGYAELLQLRPEMSNEPSLRYIVEQGEQAAQLTQQILDFSRQSTRNPRPVDLAAFLEKALQFVGRTIPERVRLRLEVPPGDFVVSADPTQLQQVMTNLALNARDAMPAGGNLTFSLEERHFAPGQQLPGPDLKPGRYVVLRVTDTGTGIPATVLPRIFEPFFTTKAPGRGTGLGLPQVYGIVKQHDGEILVDSRPDHGTTFSVFLPAISDEAPPLRGEQTDEVPRGQGQLILLVEDNPKVQEVTRALLKRINYRVLTAADGSDALTMVRMRRAEIALVLSDAVMPNMDGLELVRALKAEAPEIKVLMMSGYRPGDAWTADARAMVEGWLQKPPAVRELAQALKRCVG